jgi:hypothetical protein
MVIDFSEKHDPQIYVVGMNANVRNTPQPDYSTMTHAQNNKNGEVISGSRAKGNANANARARAKGNAKRQKIEKNAAAFRALKKLRPELF